MTEKSRSAPSDIAALRRPSRLELPLPSEYSPPVVLEKLVTRSSSLWVAREDRLEGGTKQRAAIPFLIEMMADGFREFVYASPFAGFAQVALAVSCRTLGARCTIFAEPDRSRPGAPRLHSFSELAAQHGADVELVEDLHAAEAAASDHAGRATTFKIPLGFACDAYRRSFERELKRLWPGVREAMGGPPETLWVALGSGTLTRVLREIVEPRVRLRSIDVGVLAPSDPRVVGAAQLPRTTVERAVEAFEAEAEVRPPIRSNAHYDAKLWRYLERQAGPRDLWWNVAR